MALGDLGQFARAVEASWCAAWTSLGAVRDPLPTIVDDTPGYLRVFTPAAPELLLNATISRPGASAPRDLDDLERIIAPYRRNRLPFQWWLLSGAEPEGQRAALRALRMESCGASACMALPLESWTPPAGALATPDAALPGEDARRVTSREDARAVLGVICRVFYVPTGPMARWTSENRAFTLYLTRVASQPVSALAVQRTGDTVGLSNVGTLPGYRRRGLAGRLVALALRDARREGARLATLTATPEARLLYESLGFRAVGAIEQWVPDPELMAQLTLGARAPQPRDDTDWW
jgi:GNAT superfamily N-acetyltransferase